MMAARFRSITWVAVAVVPALACYLVTQHVAAERAELARVERKIGQTRLAIRNLETELGTRGNFAQIERWNGQTFALAAPTAEQFVGNGVQLASLSALPAVARPLAPTGGAVGVTQAAVVPAAPAAVAVVRTAASPAAPDEVTRPAMRQAVSKAVSAVAAVRQAAFAPRRKAEPVVEPEPQPVLRQATYVKPARDRIAPTRVAMLTENGPLGAGTLADIGRIANAERGSRRR